MNPISLDNVIIQCSIKCNICSDTQAVINTSTPREGAKYLNIIKKMSRVRGALIS